MFSLPRDTVDVPVPPGPAQRLFGSTYSGKINSWFQAVRNRSDLLPGDGPDPRLQRAEGDHRQPLRTRHQVLRRGQLRRLPGGRRRDRRRHDQRPDPRLGRPLPGGQGQAPAGLHPERDPAHGRRPGAPVRAIAPRLDRTSIAVSASSGSCSRSASRPNPQDLIPRLPELINALKKAVRTDIPVDQLSQLLGLASSVDTKDIRSYVFTPPFYQTEYLNSPRGYIIVPSVAEDPGGGQDRVHDRARPTRRSARSSPTRRPGSGSSTAAPIATARTALRATSTSTAWPRRRHARSRPARSRRLRRSWSTTAASELPGHDRVPRADVRREVDRRRPTPRSGPTSSSRSERRRPTSRRRSDRRGCLGRRAAWRGGPARRMTGDRRSFNSEKIKPTGSRCPGWR